MNHTTKVCLFLALIQKQNIKRMEFLIQNPKQALNKAYLKELKYIVAVYRQELEILLTEEEINPLKTNSMRQPFPYGCCLNTSRILMIFLEFFLNPSSIKLISGNSCEHFWLEYEHEIYIDLTANQFDIDTISPVIVVFKSESKFHERYKSSLKEEDSITINPHHPLLSFEKNLRTRVMKSLSNNQE